jgi:basic membrane protein A and related proteins
MQLMGGKRIWVRDSLRALLGGVLVAATLFAATGCGGEGEDTTTLSTATAQGSIKKIAIIAPEKGNDFGWNQQGVESAKAMAAELGAEIEVSDGAGYGDIAPIFRQLVAGKADWIILWASGYNTVGPQLAQETGAKTLVIDAAEKGLISGLCSDFETDAQEGAYLAGMVAAKMSKSGTVGIVVSADDVNWNKMAGGFITGAKAARADIEIKLAQAGQAAYADAPAGKRVTDSVIAAGADIIFGMGDGSTFGMIEAVETAKPPAGADKVWFIDVIGDKTSLDKKNILLTSVVWDYLPVLKAAAAEIEAGTYGSKIGSIDLANGGIKLLQSPNIPADIWTEVEKAKQGIIDGTIKVPVIDNKGDLEALIN